MPDALGTWSAIADIVAVPLAIVAIILSVVLYRRSRQRKVLTYEVLSCSSLISEPEEAKEYLQIIFGGEQVRGIHLMQIKIANAGNQPIRTADYERPLALLVDEPARILTAEVVETSETTLSKEMLPAGGNEWSDRLLPELAMKMELRRMELRQALLNKGEWFTVRMLVSEYARHGFELDGRIVGAKIEKAERLGGKGRARAAAVVCVIGVGAAIAVASEAFLSGILGEERRVVKLVLYGLILVALICALLWPVRFLRVVRRFWKEM
jgi:hypothetical protein